MAAAIKGEFGLESSLKKGSGGIMKVTAGDEVVWTNESNLGYIPSDEEVLEAVRKMPR